MNQGSKTPSAPSRSTFGGSSVAVSSIGTDSKSLAVATPEQDDHGQLQLRRISSFTSSVGSPGILDYAGGEDPEEDDGNALRNESSSVIQFYPNWCHCIPCLSRARHVGQDHGGWKESLRNAFLCPPQGPLSRIITFLLMVILGWGFAWLVLIEVGEDVSRSPASPTGPITALAILLVVGLFAGIAVKQFRLPSLLGPLVLGIFLRNVTALNIFVCFQSWDTRDCDAFNPFRFVDEEECKKEAIKSSSHWITPIRQIALTMILTRAGLELSPKQLKKLKGVVPMLAFGPCLVEATVCALMTYLLFNTAGDGGSTELISVPMCFTAGFALAAVSPAVVVPGMLSLKRKNLGVGQGIPTLLIAASSIDDVLAISLYTISLGLAQAGEKTWREFAAGPISVLVGIAHGFLVGAFLHFIPAKGNRNKASTRLVLLLLLNFVSMFGYEKYELLSGAGSLAVLVSAFIASFGWRSQPHWKKDMKQIEKSLALLWTLCVPLLFGTIGREIDFRGDGFTPVRVFKILGIIVISLVIRCITAGLIAGMARLNWKERVFCGLAWVPKATVQAALAPLVVSKIQENPANDKLKPHGEIVVTLAVLAILLTAPLGSVLIAFFGSRLLRKATIPEQIKLAEEFPNGDGPETEEIVGVYTQAPAHVPIVLNLMSATSLDSVRNQNRKGGGGDKSGQRIPRSVSETAVMEQQNKPWSFWDYFWPASKTK